MSPADPTMLEGSAPTGRPLRLDDADRVAAALGARPFAPAEHRFANLWLFRARHHYRLLERPLPHVRGQTYDGVVHALTLAEPDMATARALAADGVDCLYPLGEEAGVLADRLGLIATHHPADSDYWFEGAAMATLAGAGDRRGQSRRYVLAENPVWEDWHADLADAAREVLLGWNADVARPVSRTDTAECHEAITLATVLGLEGGVVRTRGGEPVAFLLASRSGDARVIHFAKGRRAHSHAYPWMFATYARRSGAAWLNFEQDLGNPGLARSKRAYRPARLQPKYRLALAGLR